VLRDAARNPSRRQAGGRSVDHVRLAAIILAVTAPREPADVSALALPVQQAAASLGLNCTEVVLSFTVAVQLDRGQS